MKVIEIMSTNVVTCRADATVAEIARLMFDQHLSGLPVVDDDNRVIGLVTEQDLVSKHARFHLPSYIQILGGVLPIGGRESDRELRHILASTARDIMSTRPVTVSPDTEVDDVASLMVDKNANPLPVTEDGRLAGIISHSDIIRLLLIEEDGDGKS
jgi:CBS-domain-containing membrane protein